MKFGCTIISMPMCQNCSGCIKSACEGLGISGIRWIEYFAIILMVLRMRLTVESGSSRNKNKKVLGFFSGYIEK